MRLIELIERIVSLRAVRVGYLCLLFLLTLHWIDRSWIWESWEVVPGGVEHKYNYFDFKSSATLAFGAFPLLAYGMYKFKQQNLIYYALVEVCIGVLAGGLALLVLRFDTLPHWLALVAAAYIFVRGVENWEKARLAVTSRHLRGRRNGRSNRKSRSARSSARPRFEADRDRV